VIPKYNSFIKKFRTVKALSKASPRDVLGEWSGLGYNRRALNLLLGAKEVMKNHNGKLPKSHVELVKLHSIGEYTAGAIRVFAWNTSDTLVETNIRAVFIHHFFSNTKRKIDDKTIRKLVRETVDQENPRCWYTALMDYGSYLKREQKVLVSRAKSYKPQSAFKGSNREARGAIVKLILEKGSIAEEDQTAVRLFGKTRVTTALTGLLNEGILFRKGNRYILARY